MSDATFKEFFVRENIIPRYSGVKPEYWQDAMYELEREIREYLPEGWLFSLDRDYWGRINFHITSIN